MNKEIPLQQDMFTGELVDNRTAAQKREPNNSYQLGLFPVQDRIQFGERSRSWLSETPKPPLELVREDPRTPEEIERDRQKEAEKLTVSLFPTEAAPPPAAPVETADIPSISLPADVLIDDMNLTVTELLVEAEDDEDEASTVVSFQPPLTPQAAYMELVRVSEEQAATVSSTPVMTLAAMMSLNIARIEAKRAGLNETEIIAARLIGTFRGMAQWQTKEVDKPLAKAKLQEKLETPNQIASPAPKSSVPVSIRVFISQAEPVVRRAEKTPLGFRRQARQEVTKVRRSVREYLTA